MNKAKITQNYPDSMATISPQRGASYGYLKTKNQMLFKIAHLPGVHTLTAFGFSNSIDIEIDAKEYNQFIQQHISRVEEIVNAEGLNVAQSVIYKNQKTALFTINF